MRQALKWGVRGKKFEGDPSAILPPLRKVYEPRRRHLALDEFGKLLAELRTHRRNRTIVTVYTGARRSDVERLIWQDPSISTADGSIFRGRRPSSPIATCRSATVCARGSRQRWAELMRRVFEIDVLACPSCGGRMKPIAEITDRALARRMLAHVGLPGDPAELWPARGPPELLGSSGLDDDQGWPDDASEPTTPDAD